MYALNSFIFMLNYFVISFKEIDTQLGNVK